MLEVVGRTQDGKAVVRGVYRFFETHGLPLDVLVETLLERDCMPDWFAFREEANAAGVSDRRLRERLAMSLPASLASVVIDRLGLS